MKENKQKNTKNSTFLDRAYKYLDEQSRNKTGRENTNNIISTIFVGLLLLYLTTKSITFGVANIIFCSINIIISAVQIHKKRNTKINIAILIFQICYIFLSLIIIFSM